MSTPLRKLQNRPHGNIASRAFLDFRNFAIPGVMLPADIERRLASTFSSTVEHAEGLAAIREGFDAARRN